MSEGTGFWSHSLMGSARQLSPVLWGATVVAMVGAALFDTVVPMILTALGQDPAQSSSIILTTLTDVVGFLTFLGLATAFAAML